MPDSFVSRGFTQIACAGSLFVVLMSRLYEKGGDLSRNFLKIDHYLDHGKIGRPPQFLRPETKFGEVGSDAT